MYLLLCVTFKKNFFIKLFIFWQTKHKETDLYRYYTVPEDISKTIFQYGGLPKSYANLCHIFTETSIMVRKPFFEVVNCIESVDFSKPAVRIVLCILF